MAARISAMAVATVGLALTANLSAGAENRWVFDATAIQAVDVTTGPGSVDVGPVDGAEAVIELTGPAPDSNCAIVVELQGTVLTARAQGKGGLFNPVTCGSGFKVRVPDRVTASVRTGSGSIAVSGLKGSLGFTSGSGAVSIEAPAATIVGKSGSGNVTCSGLSASAVEIEVGSGSIDLTWARAAAGSVDVGTGSGSVTVSLPAASVVQADIKTANGVVTNDFGATGDGKARADALFVRGRAGNGPVRIRKL